MFEKAPPQKIPHAKGIAARHGHVPDPASLGSVTDGERGEALPLRAIEWSELTARLNAARDLRHLLREDIGSELGAEELGFADAAAQFFRTNDDDEDGVNYSTLEARKTSSGKYENVKSDGSDNTPFANHDSADGIALRRRVPSDAREEQ